MISKNDNFFDLFYILYNQLLKCNNLPFLEVKDINEENNINEFNEFIQNEFEALQAVYYDECEVKDKENQKVITFDMNKLDEKMNFSIDMYFLKSDKKYIINPIILVAGDSVSDTMKLTISLYLYKQSLEMSRDGILSSILLLFMDNYSTSSISTTDFIQLTWDNINAANNNNEIKSNRVMQINNNQAKSNSQTNNNYNSRSNNNNNNNNNSYSIKLNPIEESKYMYDKYHEKMENSPNKTIENTRTNLPVFQHKDHILELISKNQVILISGETGCGKTTQIGQYLLNHSILSKNSGNISIICSQPRRIAAIGVCNRVCEETGTNSGDIVGYSIRGESRLSIHTHLQFCTSGVLLRTLQNDSLLSNYSHIILDEIHERDINIEFLLILLKRLISKRKDLKLILMSATVDADLFSKYFNNCPVVTVFYFIIYF